MCKYGAGGAGGGVVSEVSAEKLWSGHEGSDVLAVCKVLEDSVEVSEVADRVRVNCSDDLEMSMELHDVTQEDGGLYRCNFSTDTGEQTTRVILLTIIPVPGQNKLTLTSKHNTQSSLSETHHPLPAAIQLETRDKGVATHPYQYPATTELFLAAVLNKKFLIKLLSSESCLPNPVLLNDWL